MDAAVALDDILRACERLRYLPESRWLQPPIAPLGARAVQQRPDAGGASLEHRVVEVATLLMAADAQARGVVPVGPNVSVFALADVVAALAKSVAALQTEVAARVLEVAANAATEW